MIITKSLLQSFCSNQQSFTEKNVTLSSNLVTGQTETDLSFSAFPKWLTDYAGWVSSCNSMSETKLWAWEEQRAASETPATPGKPPGSFLPSRSLQSVEVSVRNQNLKFVQTPITSSMVFASQETWHGCKTLKALAVKKQNHNGGKPPERTRAHTAPQR